MTDLFEKPRSKKYQLLQYIMMKHYVRTSGVVQWGLDNFSGRARTAAQELCADGYIRRLSKDEKLFRFGKIREDVYEFVKDMV